MTSEARVVPRSAARVADYPPGATFGPRRLHDHEFVWVLHGSARWNVESPGQGEASVLRHEEHLRPGVLALVPAGTIDCYHWDEHGPSSHAYVHFQITGSDPGPGADLRQLTRPLLPTHPLGVLCRYLLDLANLDDPRARERSDQVVALLWDLFVRGPLPPSAISSAVPERLRPSLDFVRRSWASEGVRRLPVATVAAAGSFSGAHFSRAFQHHFGCGPAAALELVRLARSAITLQRSNLELSCVARMTGFSDPFHFSHRFSAAYGLPPGRFRRSLPPANPLAPVEQAGLLPLWRILSSPDT